MPYARHAVLASGSRRLLRPSEAAFLIIACTFSTPMAAARRLLFLPNRFNTLTCIVTETGPKTWELELVEMLAPRICLRETSDSRNNSR